MHMRLVHGRVQAHFRFMKALGGALCRSLGLLLAMMTGSRVTHTHTPCSSQ